MENFMTSEILAFEERNKLNGHSRNQFKHVCPRNCYSSCTMISEVQHGQLAHIKGDPGHPYSRGKLCGRGYSYVERNKHASRLKFPYYQKVKGSGKFRQISWEKAFELIMTELKGIHDQFGSFEPLAFYKGSGNIGVHHHVTEHFFHSIDGARKINKSAFSTISHEGDFFEKKAVTRPQVKRSLIIIWGANPAVTNIHLIPSLIQAGLKGAKLVVIDPLYTQTAELADLFLQIKPNTDDTLINLLANELIEARKMEDNFSFHAWKASLKEESNQEHLKACGISEKGFSLLFNWLQEAKAVTHIIGFGLQRYENGSQKIQAIENLATIHKQTGKTTNRVFQANHLSRHLFNNQQFFCSKQSEDEQRVVDFADIADSSSAMFPVEMLWISCGNPLSQEPNSRFIKEYLESIPFVVTVDPFITPTTKMSNLVLPTTTHFEEWDVVINFWHGALTLNEKAVRPYFQSRSEWRIMTELAGRLKKANPSLCSFPIYPSEEDYLNAQFNEKIRDLYGVESIVDLKRNDNIAMVKNTQSVWKSEPLPAKTKKLRSYTNGMRENRRSPETGETGKMSRCCADVYSPEVCSSDRILPTEEFPFWLFTLHHPYLFNSQFQFINISDEEEAFVGIHPATAKALRITNGEIVKIYNRQASIEIKAVYSNQVPRDIVFIYQGWYSKSQINPNQLIPFVRTQTGENLAQHYTFVNISKLGGTESGTEDRF